MPRIELTLRVAAPPERCFDLSRSVEVHVASTRSTGEQAVAGVTSGLLGPGDQVTWRARHLGVWQHLTSRISAYDRPRHFRDSMVRGAFRRFDHDHFFEADGQGGTVMRDVFDFSAPLGPVGAVVAHLFLTRYMRGLLAARNRMIQSLAEGDGWRRFLP